MNRRTAIIVTVAVLIAIAIGAAIYLLTQRNGGEQAQMQNASQAPQAAPLFVGSNAPEFQAASTGGFFDLKTAKKPVLLEVFATWCPHCQRETVVMNELYEQFKNHIDVIAVSGSDAGMDGQSPASEADVFEFAQRFNVRYPIAFDGSLTVAKLYLQGGYPTIAIIGTDKKIAYLSSGEVSAAVLGARLRNVR